MKTQLIIVLVLLILGLTFTVFYHFPARVSIQPFNDTIKIQQAPPYPYNASFGGGSFRDGGNGR